MRAAVLRGHRGVPEVEQWQPPDPGPGEALVEMRAAPITPLDLLCASGTSYFGPPELPYVPGVQGVGLVLNAASVPSGSMAWFSTRAGMAPGDGSLRECCSVAEADLVPLAFDVKPELIAALGLSAVAAWMALTWRGELHPGEQVIVLGGGGTVGQVAVQAARLLGARRVIAGCRSAGAAERAQRCGADAVVRLDTDDVAELARRFTDASDGPVDLVIDPLFGPPAAAALRTLRHYGRLVQLGSAAAETAPDRQFHAAQPLPAAARLHEQRADRDAARGRAQRGAVLRRCRAADRRLRVGAAGRHRAGVGPPGPRRGPRPHRRDLLAATPRPIRRRLTIPSPQAYPRHLPRPQPVPGSSRSCTSPGGARGGYWPWVLPVW